ncbi:hypothetical protein Pcinc_028198 [Petrolisthes cinctipes]|uniref:Uncharacterized protein n=1 Tax=Petrolisthes cinctipes TaxID=88211 RepID=A0AAE1F429_PETCI|nr:hypothetical protein Pcinc_028198 [Petrolisthes cinctipes]
MEGVEPRLTSPLASSVPLAPPSCLDQQETTHLTKNNQHNTDPTYIAVLIVGITQCCLSPRTNDAGHKTKKADARTLNPTAI